MELPGMVIDEQVIDLLACPPVPDVTGHHHRQLCAITEDLLRLQRGTQVALWREVDEMVTREGTRRAVDITADWVHAHSGLLLRDARALVTMSVRMCASPAVLRAFADGDFGEREAKHIVDFLAYPPKNMNTDPATGKPRDTDDRDRLREEVTASFLLAAGSRDMRVLRAHGEHLRDTLSGEVNPGDDIDRNTFDIEDYGTGRVRLRGDVDTETGANLRAALKPFMDARPEHDGSPDARSASRVRADGLSELVRRRTPAAAATSDTDDAPGTADATSEDSPSAESSSAEDSSAESASAEDAGADAAAAAQRGPAVQPRISIHIPLELLFGDIPTHTEAIEMIKDGRVQEVFARTGRGWMSHMNSVSVAAAQRLACDCELTMIGADIHGAPLTVVTAHRFATRKHRIALEGRDKGCAFPNCDRPPDWTQAHHMIPWEMRHQTQVDGLCLLCTAHHVAVHHQGWEVALGATRYPVFRPPVKIDPLRRWRDSNGNYTDDPPAPETFFEKGA